MTLSMPYVSLEDPPLFRKTCKSFEVFSVAMSFLPYRCAYKVLVNIRLPCLLFIKHLDPLFLCVIKLMC